jgi:diguanylate cyclase (GGDEF)-like protein
MQMAPKGSRPTSLYGLVFGLWLALSLAGAAFVLILDMRNERYEFLRRANTLYEHVLNVVDTNDSVVEGFAALLSVMGDELDRDKVAGYARQMLERYPHIFAFEIAQRVLREELDAFVDLERRNGYPDFRITAFSYETDRSWREVEDKPLYYPVVFLEPLTAESRSVLGLDLDSNPFFKRSLMDSAESRSPLATHPFLLVEGDPAYVIHRPVEAEVPRAHADGYPYPYRYALLVIKAHSLLPAHAAYAPGMQVMLYHAHFAPDDPEGLLAQYTTPLPGHLATVLFPHFRYSRGIENAGQPFVLSVTEQVGWQVMPWASLAAVLGGAALSLAVLLAYANAHHRSELRRLEMENTLFYLANYDDLTGLSNRSHLMDRLRHAQHQADRQGTALATIFLDLDGFKEVNDGYGHKAGDELLKRVAQRLLASVRQDDTVARLGGDEFLIVLENVAGREEVALVAHKVKDTFLQPFVLGNTEIQLGASVGVAIYPDDAEDIHKLIIHADQAMYRDKEARAGTAM